MVEDEDYNKAAHILNKAKRIVVFTGSGISKESGIPTFRGKDGLWKNYRAEELATPHAFANDPEKVWEWYDWRRQIILKAKLNPAHRTLAEMEKHYPDFTLITQNVDGLHRKAGSENIIELHGNLWNVRCPKDGRIFEYTEVPLKEIPPKCQCGSIIRPDVVWFGESLPRDEIRRAFSSAEQCNVILVVGTSGIVQPAASIPVVAKSHGASVIEINLEPTPLSQIADVTLLGPAGEVLPNLWKKIPLNCLKKENNPKKTIR